MGPPSLLRENCFPARSCTMGALLASKPGARPSNGSQLEVSRRFRLMGSFSGSKEGPDGMSGPSSEYSLHSHHRLVLWGTALDLQGKDQASWLSIRAAL